MKKPLIIFALLACAAAGFAQNFTPAASAQDAKAQPAPPSVEERIRRVEEGLLPATVIKGQPLPVMPLAERMKFYKVPGVSVAVVSGGKIEWARGFGVKDVSTNEPVTTETLFQAGSISKPVAALAALRLVQEGKLSLDEDVNAKLVSWKLPDSEFTKEKKVTLRRLLTHSAGLTVHGFPGYAADEAVPTLVQVLNGEKPANTAAIRVDTAPGTIWRYSGGGYTVMQQMLVDVLKKPFPDIVKQLVLDPAGMKHSTYEQPLPAARAKDAATAYVGGQPVKGRFHTYPEMAAAGLWTTPTDLAALIIELQKSYAGASNKIISKGMAAQMLSRQFSNWGLGPSVEARGQTVEFTHGGSDEGFESFWTGFSDGRGVVVMTNGDRGNGLAMEIIASVARDYGWTEHPLREREVAKVDPKIYEAYVGDYEFKVNPQLTIVLGVSLEGGKLLVQQNGGAKREWLPASETEFFSLASPNTLVFVRDAQGAVGEINIKQGGETFTGKRIK
ncbi:MAG TPA: serine hydrolase [Pyrinomonadaceae bacterium]|jgi:CubicO group peptidase (beta-lactamase class C family)